MIERQPSCRYLPAVVALVLIFAFAGPVARAVTEDCNGNAVPDLEDVDSGFAVDCNGNGVPDECDVVLPEFRELGVPFDAGTVRAIFWEDVNNDGLPALLQGTATGAVVALATEDAGVVHANLIASRVDGLVRAWEMVDLNGDSFPDLAARAGRAVHRLLNNGDGTFSVASSFTITGISGFTFAAADFDNDGVSDLVVGDSGEDVVRIAWGGEEGAGRRRLSGRRTPDGDGGGRSRRGRFPNCG